MNIGRDGNTASDHWATPKKLYDDLDKEFNFDFDPCPLHADFDGLSVEWGISNFVNPHYNRFDKPKFIKKAYEEWKKGKTCVLLIPSAPNAEIRFLRGRVAFCGVNTKGEYVTTQKGKHDSMIVIFRSCNNQKTV